MMNKAQRKNTTIIVGAIFILGLLTVSNLLLTVGIIPTPEPTCPGQNFYWVVTNGILPKTSQRYHDDVYAQPYLTKLIPIEWYTDYYGINESITRGEMKDWHIQTTIDISSRLEGENAVLTMRIYHASNLYPETILWEIVYGNTGDNYFTLTVGEQTVTITTGSTTLNLGTVNNFSLSMTYINP